MPAAARAHREHLLDFNLQMLDQALAVVREHSVPAAPSFAGLVGSHLRHVIEHYEALIQGVPNGVVDYDGRPRDRQLENSPAVAQHRLLLLRDCLDRWPVGTLGRAVQVLGQGGTVGDFSFSVDSTIGRELAFLASHAVHHFALLATHLQQHGVRVPAHFGKAPGTVANEIATRRACTQPLTQESSCPLPSLAA